MTELAPTTFTDWIFKHSNDRVLGRFLADSADAFEWLDALIAPGDARCASSVYRAARAQDLHVKQVKAATGYLGMRYLFREHGCDCRWLIVRDRP